MLHKPKDISSARSQCSHSSTFYQMEHMRSFIQYGTVSLSLSPSLLCLIGHLHAFAVHIGIPCVSVSKPVMFAMSTAFSMFVHLNRHFSCAEQKWMISRSWFIESSISGDRAKVHSRSLFFTVFISRFILFCTVGFFIKSGGYEQATRCRTVAEISIFNSIASIFVLNHTMESDNSTELIWLRAP